MLNLKEFHDCAYNSRTRQDIIRGISSYSNRSFCLVLPIGEFDEDLLIPVIEWMKNKLKNKMLKLENKNEENMSTETEVKLVSKKADFIKIETIADKIEFDPFKRSGHLFGALFNEINHRYSKYFSDIKDGFNLHCMIATIFIFTVCVAPALCFGGILGMNMSILILIFSIFPLTELNVKN